MMARMLSQLPLPLLPAGVAGIAPDVALWPVTRAGWLPCLGWRPSRGMAEMWSGAAGGGAAGPAAGRLAGPGGRGVQGRSAHNLAVGSGAGCRWMTWLVSALPGPKGASKLTPPLVERITGLDAAGATLGCSTPKWPQCSPLKWTQREAARGR
jgi:hypothetical protein